MASLTPQIVSRQNTPQFATWDMLVHPVADRAYIGGMFSYDSERKNLTVMSVNTLPRAMKSYADVNIPLPIGNVSFVLSIATNSTATKLYLLVYEKNSSFVGYYLTIYNLTTLGDITGTPFSYQLSKKTAENLDDKVVLHPSLPLLYISNGAGIQVYALDGTGLPAGATTGTPFNSIVPVANLVMSTGGDTINSLAIHPNGARMYAGAFNVSLNKYYFIVAKLDTTGKLFTDNKEVGDSAYTNDFWWGSDTADNELSQSFYLFFTPKAVYRRTKPIDGRLGDRRSKFPFRLWTLDSNGDATGSKIEVKDFNGVGDCFFPTTQSLYISKVDSFTDLLDATKTRINGFLIYAYAVDINGVPIVPIPAVAALGSMNNEDPFLVRASESVTPKLLVLTRHFTTSLAYPIGTVQIRNQYLRCTITNSIPVVDTTWKISVIAADNVTRLTTIAVGASNVVIIPLDPFLAQFTKQSAVNTREMLKLELEKGTTPVNQATWQLEYFQGVPGSGGTLLKPAFTDTNFGNQIILLIDSCDVQAGGMQGRANRFDLLSNQWKQWSVLAANVAVTISNLPKKFIVSAYEFALRQPNQNQLNAMAKLVKSFGFNTMIMGGSSSNENADYTDLPPHVADNTITQAGLTGLMGAEAGLLSGLPGFISTSLETFDFGFNAANLQDWASYLATKRYLPFNWIGIINFIISDELGWYYVPIFATLSQPANSSLRTVYLTKLQSWLPKQGLTPADFGATTWSSVTYLPNPPVPATASLTDKKLYYWTIRFLQVSAINAIYQVKTALQNEFHTLKTAPVTLNNFACRWKIFTALSLDWFEAGRSVNQTLWTEAAFDDHATWEWSLNMDLMSCAANASHARPTKDLQMGAYIHADYLGAHPAGAFYKLFALISRNGKIADFYNLGIYDSSNKWVMYTEKYPAIAQSISLLGKAESLLFEGAPPRGNIAILSIGSSTIWDELDDSANYITDMKGIYLALVHEGYTIDFIDDVDITNNYLTLRGYHLLYITAPNVSDKACKQISSWVKNGGTVVVTQGAATMNEYYVASTILDSVLGVAGRNEHRESFVSNQRPTNTLLSTGTGSSALPQVWTDTIQAIIPATTTGTLYKFDSTAGKPAITVNNFGAGKGCYFNFLPGVQYYNARYEVPAIHILPQISKWRDQYRAFTLLPVGTANAKKLVTISNHKLIEACLMTSFLGIAIVLFNWNNDIQTNVQVSIPVSRLYTKIESGQGISITGAAITANNITFMLATIQYVDVIMIT